MHNSLTLPSAWVMPSRNRRISTGLASTAAALIASVPATAPANGNEAEPNDGLNEDVTGTPMRCDALSRATLPIKGRFSAGRNPFEVRPYRVGGVRLLAAARNVTPLPAKLMIAHSPRVARDHANS